MGKTIGNILLSYDVNRSHTLVKEAMFALGYMESFQFTNSNVWYDLPNTTLLHINKTSDQAMFDLKEVCSGLNVTLEKAIAAKTDELVGFPRKG